MRWPCRWPTAGRVPGVLRTPGTFARGVPGRLPRRTGGAAGKVSRAFGSPGENAMNVQLSIVRADIREYRKKHRWKESNPRDAGLESGPQPLRTDVACPKAGDIEKGAACCRTPGSDGSWEALPLRRSPRWAARTRAQLDRELVVEGVFAHGSQACRQNHGARPPCLSRVPRAVHDVSSVS